MVSIGQLSEYAKSGPPTAVKGILTSTLHRDRGGPGVHFIPYTMYMRSDRNHRVRVSASASCYNLHCRRYPGAPRPERRVCLL